MKIVINNVGIINYADIQIDGITIITGKNDTGKSTVSKCLYAMWNCFSKMDIKVNEVVKKRLNQEINDLLFFNFKNFNSKDVIKKQSRFYCIDRICKKIKM